MKKFFAVVALALALGTYANAQKVGIKTNLLYDATTTMNLGVEVGLGHRTSLDISGNYNPWEFTKVHNPYTDSFDARRKMKLWMVQPEFRLWTCERFNGGFWGIHAHGGEYNFYGMLPFGFKNGKMFGAVESESLNKHRFQGWMVGAGISYGYHWILGNHWGLEAEIGAGYAYLDYDQYLCGNCGPKDGSDHVHYFGPTKAAISLIYLIK